MTKDYYAIMGLKQEASDQDIKIAYRKLARKYHPDISKEPDAEERFKEMGEAYEVLKDKNKRAEYDAHLANAAFNTQNQQQYAGQQNYTGQHPGFDSDFFESIFGHARSKQQPMAGQHYTGNIQITLKEAFEGTIKSLQVPTTDNKTQVLKVKIPPGIKSGQQIRLAGQGGISVNGGPRGDILITVTVLKDPLFDVMGNDLYLNLPITPWESALGAQLEVPTLAGKIALKIPPGTQSGQKLRIKGKGLPGKTPGDQYVLVKIVTPPANTPAATDLYAKMAETMPFNPRVAMGV